MCACALFLPQHSGGCGGGGGGTALCADCLVCYVHIVGLVASAGGEDRVQKKNNAKSTLHNMYVSVYGRHDKLWAGASGREYLRGFCQMLRMMCKCVVVFVHQGGAHTLAASEMFSTTKITTIDVGASACVRACG